MLVIIPIEEKEVQKEITERCGMEFCPELFCYQAVNNDALLAAADFDIPGSCAVIHDMRQVTGTPDDYEAMFILGRAVMNFLDLCGVAEADYRVTDEYSRKMAGLLGFRKEGERYHVILTGMFTEPCKHGNSYRDTADNV